MEKGFVIEYQKISGDAVFFNEFRFDEPMFCASIEEATFYSESDIDEASDDYRRLSERGYDVEISAVSRAR